MGGKDIWGMGDEEFKGRRNGESINLVGRCVTELLTLLKMRCYINT